ncbi:MAG: Glucose-6-phosphate 1-dehydrogenase 1 [Acidimicrobiales bacterium]|nr:MAG: glucose-6-phosphate dehydrogenase [Actinomycetota bacterium]MBV6509024.1 Glucose-6-phosphate 1-dehydrogenase 1 [Acidimicrobiales bacterium]RIK06264.1 MAG: glucose-6-phosphate dehydrogenase [Acidobacteriota bacterium]
MEKSDSFVQFGATGDLARKMTFVSLYRLAEKGRLDVPVIGVASNDWDVDTFRNRARADIVAAGQQIDEGVWQRLASSMDYVQGDYTRPDTYERVKDALSGASNPLFYLEIPPGLFETVVQGLYNEGLTRGSRVVVEKPFGHDLESAIQLNASLSGMLDEDQIYRIDHYLGKNAVEDIMVWRFANRMVEPIWNSDHIEAVMITMAESFDVSDRGHFYDDVGALKDVVQNHLMQVTGLLAMEPPTRNTPAAIHAEQVKVFDAIEPVEPGHFVRGQYDGYLDVDGVRDGSTTETYVALRIDIDSWRWAKVPFLIRAGKSLSLTATEVVVRFRRPPLTLFDQVGARVPDHNVMRLLLGPTGGVRLHLQAKDPTAGMTSVPVVAGIDFHQELGDELLPYELLLGEALEGDSTLFATQAMIEGTWRALQPVLDQPGEVITYRPGSMGPAEADAMAGRYGGWVDPVGGASDEPA